MADPDSRLRSLTEDPARFLADPDPILRRLAVSAMATRVGEAGAADAIVDLLRRDPEPAVRAEAAEVAALAGAAVGPVLLEAAATDADARVLEAVATALGEIAEPAAVAWLMAVAADHDDRPLREAAVAALGAIGDDAAVPLLIDLVATAPPQIRRRCVVALTAFEGEAVSTALESALADRNPMVREAAEMVVGRPFDDGGWTPLSLRPTGDGAAEQHP